MSSKCPTASHCCQPKNQLLLCDWSGRLHLVWSRGGRFAQLLHRFNQVRNFTTDHDFVIADLLSRGKTNDNLSKIRFSTLPVKFNTGLFGAKNDADDEQMNMFVVHRNVHEFQIDVHHTFVNLPNSAFRFPIYMCHA